MMSIKDKIELMIFLANGEVVRRCHAKAAGILVADEGTNPYLKAKKHHKSSNQS
jgi:hypothetical protein